MRTRLDVEIIYVNSASDLGEKLKFYSDRGDTIVNACRPLSGDEAWEGEYLRGIHYATLRSAQIVDEQTIKRHDRVLKHWTEYDAREVRIVSNQQIAEAFNVELLRRNLAEKLKQVTERYGTEETIAKYAKTWLNMPYLQ
jgi:hypothetical protein